MWPWRTVRSEPRTVGVSPAHEASFRADGKRLTSPTSAPLGGTSYRMTTDDPPLGSLEGLDQALQNQAAWRGEPPPDNGEAAALLAARRAEEERIRQPVSTWEPANVAAILAGGLRRLEPRMLKREDGAALLYPGKIHAFNAAPEEGKSWLALAACRERLRLGGSRPVLWST